MLATEPARLAERAWAVPKLSAPIPGNVAALNAGVTGPRPKVTEGRVVWVPPLLADSELERSISNPNWNECFPWIQLSESPNCQKGLVVIRGAETFMPAYNPSVPPNAPSDPA